MSACHATPSAGTGSGAPPLTARDASLPATPEATTALHITDAVVSKVSELLADEGDATLRLRICVTGGGCSGLQYAFSFDDALAEDDVLVVRDPIGVVVDALSLQYLLGSEIDYEERLEGARFVIRNPNAATTCGCGSSFSV